MISRHLKKFKFWKKSVTVVVLVSCALVVRRRRLSAQDQGAEHRVIRQPHFSHGPEFDILTATSAHLFPLQYQRLHETTKLDVVEHGVSEGCSTVHLVMVVCDGAPTGERTEVSTGEQSDAPTARRTKASTGGRTGKPTEKQAGASRGEPTDNMFSLGRQLEQVTAALKSAVLLSSCPLVIHIVTHDEEIFDAVMDLTKDWSVKQLSKVTFELHTTWFPAEQQHLRSAFRPCSAQRLFLPRVLADLDAVVYMDTDYLFLRPPQHLWGVLTQFSPRQAIAGASPRFTPEEEIREKSLSSGFNAGLLLLNLTRLRAFPGGWEAKVLEVLSNDSVNDDQDALNYIFEESPDYLHQLDCRWNFRHFFCTRNFLRTVCPSAIEEGAFGVHGVTGAFQSGEDAVMRALYLTWWNFDMSKTKDEFILTLTANLANSQKFGPCHLYKHIAHILTYQLENEF